MITVRKGQAGARLEREAFRQKFMDGFFDPAYEQVAGELAAIEQVAWEAYRDKRKAPRTAPAGPGFADPGYALSVEWQAASARLQQAQQVQQDPATRTRVLLINASARNDGSCPGELSKSWRLTKIAREVLAAQDIDTDLLDLSRLTSDYDRHIHPCKACASTAMPLCHWPCSCYPNHAERQTGDWMNEIYERWVAAHGVIILTPVYWYQAPSTLKLMIDRLVCADGGNPDPTSTQGKDAQLAKEIELAGWDYPKHLAGRAFGLVVHGDVAGIEGTRRALSDWLGWMGLVDSGSFGALDRFIGYYESYAASHEALDADLAVQEEVRNVARAVALTVQDLRAGRLLPPAARLKAARPK
jgi:multimeric flavodoxin WrbA